jgi:hypothetical protein
MHLNDYELPDDEAQAVIRAVLRGQNDKLHLMTNAEAEAELEVALQWAKNVRLLQALLDLVEAGELDLTLNDEGNLCFIPRPRGVIAPPPFSAN